ncbi:hypothetical protein [Mitsuaria sp. GD03876]|uniref:hypothetical protein n=1 Tax=Mitsuaria sp. GD03876 TaxID=2975399 RepID=UPI00244AB8F8|nr:hypothetical protein [Mitsuaria sp. GD03876]MDH0862988.1 hypothetical protein [Mitsuaria sp. GD03876]
MTQAASRTGGRTEFATEADFVERFVGKLSKGRTSFGKVQITQEWDHRAGFVDVLARHRRKTLVAFEAKLDNWKRAFHQAYRSTAYANKSYVIVPTHVANRALRDRDEFELRGVGLCSFDGKSVQVLIEASEQDALLIWLREQAHEHFDALEDELATEPGSGRRAALPAMRI